MERAKLFFQDGDKKKKLRQVVITTEEFNCMQIRICFFFPQSGPKKNKLSFHFVWIGDYIPKEKPDWIYDRFIVPARRQARALFNKYNKKQPEHG